MTEQVQGPLTIPQNIFQAAATKSHLGQLGFENLKNRIATGFQNQILFNTVKISWKMLMSRRGIKKCIVTVEQIIIPEDEPEVVTTEIYAGSGQK